MVKKISDKLFFACGVLVFGMASVFGVIKGGSLGPIILVGGVLLYISAGLAFQRWVLNRFIVALALCIMLLGGVCSWASPVNSEGFAMVAHVMLIVWPLVFVLAPAVLQNLNRNPYLHLWPYSLGFGVFGLAVFLAQYTYPYYDDYNLAKLNRGATYAVIFFWPAALVLWQARKKFSLTVLAAMYVPVLILTHSRSAQIAVIAAMLTFGLALVSRKTVILCLSVCVVIFAFWPLWAMGLYSMFPELVKKLPDSWLARMEIWDFMASFIEQRPFAGWGVGASSVLEPTETQKALFRFTKGAVGHSHNFIVQLWLELGLAGLACGVVVCLVLIKKIRQLPDKCQAFALAAFVSAFSISLISYNLWTDSLLGCIGFSLLAFAGLDTKKCIEQVDVLQKN